MAINSIRDVSGKTETTFISGEDIVNRIFIEKSSGKTMRKSNYRTYALINVARQFGPLWLLLVAIGCGNGSGLVLVPVKGKVTVGGSTPFANGSVRFTPKTTGKTALGGAETDAEGNYVLKHRGQFDGIEAGEYLVSFSQYRMPDGSPLPDQSAASERQTPLELGAIEFVPKEYADLNSALNPVTIPKSGGTFNFDIPKLNEPRKTKSKK